VQEPTPRQRLLSLAHREGFDHAGIAAASVPGSVREAALGALGAGHLEGMEWITADWLTRATDPEAFLPGARTVLLVALPCHTPGPMPATDDRIARGRVARYAWGRDYHRVFERKLRRIARAIREDLGAAARATVDYGPLLERPLAASAGLGWLGKSTMLLVPGLGPWVLLGVVATSLAADPDAPLRKSCGACSRCVVACPTGALGAAGGLLDARLCISYHTIENRGPIPRDLRDRFGDWIFGCDECLDSCPVGLQVHDAHPGFAPRALEDARPALAPLLSMDEEAFRERFQGRAIARAKRDGFLRNVCVALGNVGLPEDLPALLAAAQDRSPLVRGHAAWGAGALARRHGLEREAHAMLSARHAAESDPWVREELALACESLQGLSPPARGSPASSATPPR